MKRGCRGVGLVEIMVTLVLGLVISMGVIQIFSASRATFTSQNAAARLQEDARFVLSKMIQELRMTGMYGCLKPTVAWPTALDNPILWDNTSKTLTLVTADVGTAGGTPTWTIVSDCRTSSLWYSGASSPASGQTAFPLRMITYTLSGTTLNVKTGLTGSQQPLLQGVATLEVSFGMATSPMSYTSTITAANAADIRSVRLKLTLKDSEGRAADQKYSVVAYLRNRF